MKGEGEEERGWEGGGRGWEKEWRVRRSRG